MAKEKHQCCGMVHVVGILGSFPCRNNAKFNRDGRWYCGHHDPARQEAKRRERNEKFDAEYEARQAKWKLEERQQECTTAMFAMAKLVEAVVLETASATECQVARAEWPLVVAEAVACGLIKEGE